MFNYIKVNNDNIVVGASQLSGRVEATNMFQIKDYSPEKVGKIYNPDTGEFSDPPIEETQDLRPSIVVSTTPVAISNRVTISEGTTVSLSIEVKDAKSNIIPLTETFAVPVRRIGGAVERTVGISFTDGQGSKNITWPSSGEFEITEDLINMHLPKDQHFKFDRLVFSVYE